MRSQVGVVNITAGYTGGENENPTYENYRGYAEALEIEYDYTQTSFFEVVRFLLST